MKDKNLVWPIAGEDPHWWDEFQKDLDGILYAGLDNCLYYEPGDEADIFEAISRLASNLIGARFGGQPVNTKGYGHKELQFLEGIAQYAAALAELYEKEYEEEHR